MKRLSTEEFIAKARLVHGEMYDYSKTMYLNTRTKIVITCSSHGDFLQTPDAHLHGRGCDPCSRKTRSQMRNQKSRENFVSKAKNIHGGFYDYASSNYETSSTKLTIICPNHGRFEQAPRDHLSGKGCPKCVSVISKPELDFLNYSGVPDTSENRQVRILSKKVDGLMGNVVYEFLGNYWHGNPKLFKSTDLNSITKKTFGTLYEKTMKKFKFLKETGYQIKYVWEDDWKEFRDGSVEVPNIQTF